MPSQHQIYHQLGDAGTSAINLAGLNSNDLVGQTYDPLMNNNLDALLAGDDTTIYESQFGTSLGFDEEHDWSDGVQLDMFDGFFFGGTMNGSYAS